MHLPPITIDDIPHPHKRSSYTPDLIIDNIYVASKNSFSYFTTPSDSPQILLLPYDDHIYTHVMKKYDPNHGKEKIGYCTMLLLDVVVRYVRWY